METVGLCSRIDVNRVAGKVWVTPPGAGSAELFVLWFIFGADPIDLVTGEPISAFDRVRHSMWIAMLQHAMENGHRVSVSHDVNGSFVREVRVLGP